MGEEGLAEAPREPAVSAPPDTVPAARRGRWSTAGPLSMVLGGILSVQFGSALAVTVMPRTGPAGVVALRLLFAALIALVAFRPRTRGLSRADWGTVVAFGVAMGAMNNLFYQALERIPLGPAVTLEVLGPLALSVLSSRRPAGALWAALALGGVCLLGGGLGGLDAGGAAFALAAGAMWACYIVFSARAGRRFPRADGLALALCASALLSLPVGLADAGGQLLVPSTLGLGAGVAVLSSVLPYTLELYALRGLHAATFSVLMSLEPAVACLAGLLVLRQALSVTDAVAIGLVVCAGVGAVRTPPASGNRGGTLPPG